MNCATSLTYSLPNGCKRINRFSVSCLPLQLHMTILRYILFGIGLLRFYSAGSQELAQVSFSNGTSFNYFSLLTDREVQKGNRRVLVQPLSRIIRAMKRLTL